MGQQVSGFAPIASAANHRSGFSGLWDWGVELTICSKSRPIIKRVCAPPGELLAAEMADADGDVGNQGLVKRVAFRSIGHIPSISSSERPHRRCLAISISQCLRSGFTGWPDAACRSYSSYGPHGVVPPRRDNAQECRALRLNTGIFQPATCIFWGYVGEGLGFRALGFRSCQRPSN